MADVQKHLKAHWGFDGLRPLQQKAVDAILAKKDVAVLLPTGGGKSICFQLPAVSLPGLAIVVSPLISLMQDQVNQLKKRKVKAMHLSGSLSQRELDQRVTNAALGDLPALTDFIALRRSARICSSCSDMKKYRLLQNDCSVIALAE